MNKGFAIPKPGAPSSRNNEYFYSLLKDIRKLTATSIIVILDTPLPDEIKIQELREMSKMLLED